MKFKKGKFSKEQISWCKNYIYETNFEPIMMDYFESGEISFKAAANASVNWFEDWANDALLNCDLKYMSINYDD